MLAAAVRAPLFTLLLEYDSAIAAMTQIVEALRPLTTALAVSVAPLASSQLEAPVSLVDPADASPTMPAPIAERDVLALEVTAPNEVAILEFEERLSGIPGVKYVSLKSYGHGKATLAVELEPVVAATATEGLVSNPLFGQILGLQDIIEQLEAKFGIEGRGPSIVEAER